MSTGAPRRILVVDNYDSFVFNLVQYLAQLGAECEVHRNDDVDLARVHWANPDSLLVQVLARDQKALACSTQLSPSCTARPGRAESRAIQARGDWLGRRMSGAADLPA